MKPLLHAIYRKIHFFSFSFLGGRQHFRFFGAFPMYGTLPSMPLFPISRLLPGLLLSLKGPIAFADNVEADVARAAASTVDAFPEFLCFICHSLPPSYRKTTRNDNLTTQASC